MVRSLILLLLIFLGASAVSACSCVDIPLKKKFRDASAIFVGRLAGDIPEDESLVQQGSSRGLFTFEIVKAWKGVKKDYVAIDLANMPGGGASCEQLYTFDEDTEYLVFAYGKDLKVNVVCSDTKPVSRDYGSLTQREIRKLNSFWFRSWTRIYPF